MSKRRDAVYHQQAIYEVCKLGTEFYKIPSTDKVLQALKKGYKVPHATKEINPLDHALSTLIKQADKFFNKDYNPEIDRKVSKALLKTYAELIPAEQRISIFKVIDKELKETLTPLSMLVLIHPSSEAVKPLTTLWQSRMPRHWKMT